MTETSTPVNEVRYTRILNAPRDLVFACMTEPKHLAAFWGPVGMHTPVEKVVIDLRVGGQFLAVMVNDADGSEFPSGGIYTEVVAPERLVWHDATFDMTTTSEFIDLGDGRTEVRIVQSNVPPMFSSAESVAGFKTSIDKFESYLRQLVERSA